MTTLQPPTPDTLRPIGGFRYDLFSVHRGLIMNVKVGDTVWFHSYSGVDSGTVIDIIEKNLRSTKIACVKQRDTFTTIEVDSRKMWETRQEATLTLAEKKQQEAARLLSEAADLFKRAGGMKEGVAVAAE